MTTAGTGVGKVIGRPKSSEVWDYFTYRIDLNKSECLVTNDGKKCERLLVGRNPTNLKRHLKTCHKKENDAMEEKEKTKSKVAAALSIVSKSTKLPASNSYASRKITNMIGNKHKYSAQSADNIFRRQALTRFIAKTGVSKSLPSMENNMDYTGDTSDQQLDLGSVCPGTQCSTEINTTCDSDIQNSEMKPFIFSDLSLEDLRKINENFIRERNWDQFHSPRNVLLAMVGEMGELAEIFQWKGEVSEGLPEFTEDEKNHVGEEISDILLYLVDFACRCHIDIPKAVKAKVAANAKKYPVDRAYGQANKYTDYQ